MNIAKWRHFIDVWYTYVNKFGNKYIFTASSNFLCRRKIL